MRPVLHVKNTYLTSNINMKNCRSYLNQEKIIPSNKENFPKFLLYSESTTTEENFSNENSTFEDFDDLNKLGKIKLDKKLSEDFQKKPTVDETKYKTEMCKNWEEKGKCNYGKKCKFAHGRNELVNKSLINKDRYKSKLCNSFYTLHFCPYGQRCLFIHAQPKKIEDILTHSHYRRQMNSLDFEDILKCEENKRCEIFLKMKNENQRALEKINENFCRNLVDE